MKSKNAGVVILAAGRSTRMLSTKAFLPFNDQHTFLEKIVSTYLNWGCDEIVVVVNPETARKIDDGFSLPGTVSLVVNEHLEFERFHSVKLGLKQIRKAACCFIQNVDNPFISFEILDQLYQEKSDAYYVNPTFEDKGGHPILIHKTAMEQIIKNAENHTNLREALGNIPVKRVEVNDATILLNINDPKEYNRIFL